MNPLLHEFTPNYANEARISAVGYGARQQRLAGARRPVQQDALRWIDAQLHEATAVQQRELHHLQVEKSI